MEPIARAECHSKPLRRSLSESPQIKARDALSKSRDAGPEYVLDPIDGSVLHDIQNRPIAVDRWLHTKPLKHEISSRPGPHGKKLQYLSGDSVTRTLNQVFGYDGWNLSIIKTDQVACDQQRSGNDANKGGGKWNVAYLAQVRITHVRSGSFREDIGAGDSCDKNLATAVQHALKGSITDAMKRAARHFGDKLGNSLYNPDFKYNEAPTTATQALEQYDKDHSRHYGSLSSKEITTAKPVITPSSSYYEPNCATDVTWKDAQKSMTTTSSHPAKGVPLPSAQTHVLPSMASTVTGNATKYNGSAIISGVPTANQILPNAQVISGSALPVGHDLQDVYGGLDDSFWPSNSPPSCIGHPANQTVSATELAAAHASKKQKVNPYSS